MIAPPLRTSGSFPNREARIQSWKLLSPVSPRVSVTSPALIRPGMLPISRPLTSAMCLITTPSNSSPNEWPTEASGSGSAILVHLLCSVHGMSYSR